MLAIVGVVIIIAAVIIVAVLLGGGGSSAKTPQQVSEAFWAALKKRDTTGSWNMLTTETQKAMGSESQWESMLKKAYPQDKDMITVKAGKVTINGNKATVQTSGTENGKTTKGTDQLIKENGVWKVDMTPPQ